MLNPSDDFEYILPDLHVWLLEHGLKSELKEHHCFKEFCSLDKETRAKLKSLPMITPKHQVVVSGKMGKISVIQAGAPFGQIEIYSIEGDLFEDIRRYKTVEDAGKTIVSLLETGMFDESVKRAFDVWNDLLFQKPEETQDVDFSELEDE